jgi:hypothetical protein
MSIVNIQKMAVAFALLSFGILSIGSILMGATFFTGIIRGIGGAILFGLLAFGVSAMLMREDEEGMADDDDDQEDKGTQLDQTA